MKVLLPIHIDRWQNPIASLLRTCVEYNPDIEFVSFSSPFSEEDHRKSPDFWKLPNISCGDRYALLKNRFDLVHIASHTPKNLLAGTLAKLLSFNHTRFLYTINLELPEKNRKDFIYRWFNAVVDDYASVSHAASRLVRMDAPGCFRGVIPNGYDPEFLNPQSATTEDLPEVVKRLEGAPYVLNVAALETRKHPEWILRLARENPDLNFVMAGWVVPGLGEGFYEEILNAKLPNLIWLGLVDRKSIRSLLAGAAAFAFPSDREGLPLSMIEAMGMGVPVVAQPKSSMPELMTEPFCGRLIDIDDSNAAEQWADTLRAYAHFSAEERQRLRSQLSDYARQRYSWESIGKAYGDLYRRIEASRSFSS